MNAPSLAERLLSLVTAAPIWTPAAPEYSPPSPETIKRRNTRSHSRSKGDDEGEDLSRGVAAVLALYWECPLYRDTAGGTYIDIEGRLFPLDSKCRELKERMAHDSFLSTRKTNSEAINGAISVLSHRARTEGNDIELFTRIGEADGAFWYDLGSGRAAKITHAGWIITKRPLWFRSFNHQLPQPDPVQGGNAGLFFDYVNIRPENRLLAICLLGTLFVPRIVRPLLHFIGCQGSGKTFSARLWKRLFDPSPVDLTSVPRKDEDLDLLLFRNALLCLDNLSYLPPAMADRLCAFISGAVIERRALFTDLDTTILQSICALIVTSITDLHSRADLVERTVRLEHDRITSNIRRTERELLSEFDAALPEILGGVLDLVSRAMAIHPTVKLHELPRLADAATWMYAFAEAVEPGRGRDVMRQLAENSAIQSHTLLDGDSLFAAIVSHLEAGKTLSGSFGECLADLAETAKPDPKDATFPKNANGFRSHLARLQVPLEGANITFTIDTRRTANRRSFVEFSRKATPVSEPEPFDPDSIPF
jgi:hypothetical protein